MTQNEQNSDPNAWRENPDESPTLDSSFTPTEVRIFTSDPPRYEFVVGDVTVTMSHLELVKRDAFQARCLAVLHRMVDVPRGKNAAWLWQDRVNGWLANAKRIEMSEDSSPVMFERAAVLECLESLQVASEEDGLTQDFRRGCVVVRDGRAHVSLPPLLRRLRPDFPKLGPDDLASHLRKLRWSPSSVRLDGQASAKSWKAERQTWLSMPWAPQTSEGG